MGRSEELRRIAASTRDIYERNAARFDADRVKILIERKWLERFCALLPAGGRILDAGCGTGDPIARYFIERGYRVTGVDFSQAMLAIVRSRWPDARWLWADMRRLALGETFDGIVGWHCFFHLTPEEQQETLTKLAAHLAPGGALMLTVGPEAGEVIGHVGDDIVYHASLSPGGYESRLAASGLHIVEFAISDDECDGSTILLAQKQGAAD